MGSPGEIITARLGALLCVALIPLNFKSYSTASKEPVIGLQSGIASLAAIAMMKNQCAFISTGFYMEPNYILILEHNREEHIFVTFEAAWVFHIHFHYNYYLLRKVQTMLVLFRDWVHFPLLEASSWGTNRTLLEQYLTWNKCHPNICYSSSERLGVPTFKALSKWAEILLSSLH